MATRIHSELSRIRPASGDGLQCDRCGANVVAELRTCRIEAKRLTRAGPRPEMRLCVPCIGALEAIGAKVHVKLTSDELRKKLRVLSPGDEPPALFEESIAGSSPYRPLAKIVLEWAPSILGNAGVPQRAMDLAMQKLSWTAPAKERAIEALSVAISQCCANIESAAHAAANLDSIEKDAAVRKAQAKKELTAALSKGRAKLAQITRAIAAAETQLAAREKQLAPPYKRAELARQMGRARRRLDGLQRDFAQASAACVPVTMVDGAYPPPPRGTIRPSNDGAGLPETAGIYFLWAGDAVEYVGQSIKLCARARMGHDRLRKDHLISYITVDARELDWAECWYIGALRPKLNFSRTSKLGLGRGPEEGAPG